VPGTPTADGAEAVRLLALDLATRDLLHKLTVVNVDAILLKGPSIAAQLYSDGGRRSYVDTDVLVASECLGRARAQLEHAGYECTLHAGDTPHPLHAEEWRRPSDGHPVDLHWTLPGIEASSDCLWRYLRSRRRRLELLGTPVAVLDDVGLALHVALHAAHNGTGNSKSLEDLRRALVQLPRASWVQAADLARTLHAQQPFAAALGLVPEASAVIDELDLPPVTSVMVLLQARSAPTLAAGLERLAQAEGNGARLRLIGRELFPSARVLRHMVPVARDYLALGHAVRARRLLRELPAAVRAWRSARRTVREGRP